MAEGMTRRTVLGMGAAVAGGLLLKGKAAAAEAQPKRRALIWSEGTAPKDPYPKDIRGAIADGFAKDLPDWEAVTATLTDPDQGVAADALAKTDVLLWWGHKLHAKVTDETVQRIVKRVKDEGMGFIALHSSHFAKPYKALMENIVGARVLPGALCSWREYKADGTSVDIIVKLPDHPIVKGVKNFSLPKIERYGEPFAVPTPEAVPLDGLYHKPDGSKEPGRMGLCWTVGKGKVFYFTPGHETYPDFFHAQVRLIMRNAVEWAAPKK